MLGQGLKYEGQVQSWMDERFGDWYVPGPWFMFESQGWAKPRWCQPDGLLFELPSRTITVVEIKLRHTAEAYWQTKLLYAPVLEKVFPTDLWTFNYVEVTRYHEPTAPFPVSYDMVPDVLNVVPQRFAVHIWNPQRG